MTRDRKHPDDELAVQLGKSLTDATNPALDENVQKFRRGQELMHARFAGAFRKLAE